MNTSKQAMIRVYVFTGPSASPAGGPTPERPLLHATPRHAHAVDATQPRNEPGLCAMEGPGVHGLRAPRHVGEGEPESSAVLRDVRP
jgi:hypothetical protein